MATGYNDFEPSPYYNDKIRVRWNSENGGAVYMTVQNAGSRAFTFTPTIQFILQRNQNGWVNESYYWFDYGGRYGYTFNRTFYGAWANYYYRIKVVNYHTGAVIGYTRRFIN